MFSFVKCFFFAYWDDHVIFILSFANVVYHIVFFLNVESSLWHWNKSNLITVYDLFLIILFTFQISCWGLLHLYSEKVLIYNFYLLNSLSGFGIRVIVTLCACVHAKSLQSCPTLCNPWTVAHQATLSMGFSRQEYWSGLACPPPGDLPDPGINQCLLWIQHCRWILTIEPPGQPDRDLEEWILGVFPSLAFFFFWYSLRNLFFMYLVSLSLWDISSTLSVHFFLK